MENQSRSQGLSTTVLAFIGAIVLLALCALVVLMFGVDVSGIVS